MAEELRGWKDIGAHFGTSERTAQRWEREHGMPVHRTGRTRGASVFALRDELDGWRISPSGVRAHTESANSDGRSTVVAVVEAGQPITTSLSFWRGRKTLIAFGAVAVLIVVGVLAWAILFRRPSSAVSARPLPEAYAVPKSPVVFLLRITAYGTPFVFHVLDGDMATLALRGGPKIAFAVAVRAGAATLVPLEIKPTPKGRGERIQQLKQLSLPLHSVVHFDHAGMNVDVEWIDTLKLSELPPAPPQTPRSCCIVAGDVTACAAQVSADTANYAGSCCGFSGCKDAK